MGPFHRLMSRQVPCQYLMRQGLTTCVEPLPSTALNGRHATPFVIRDTGKKERCKLTTQRPNVLTWYSCGPTVYDACHVGHGTTFVRSDILRRILEAEGITVIQVMGITDIDDKIIHKANQTGTDWKSVGRQYERDFVADLGTLNCLKPHVFTRVSDYIPEIIGFVGKLIENGSAYRVDTGSVYFDTEKYGEKYGLFRRLPEGEGEPGEGKKSSKDFALWKCSKPGEPFWEAPWGNGRPGWHIECSVMASRIFGSSLDLHTGGRDLIFPHHENEEAQCCAYFGSSQWTAHWLHTGHLHFKGDAEKMSKSLGNTIPIPAFLEKYSPDVLRIMCLSSKYRNNLEYSSDTLENAEKVLRKFTNFISDTSAILSGVKHVSSQGSSSEFWSILETAKLRLTNALHSDFDTPEALKIVIETISEFYRHFPDASISTPNCSPDFQLILAHQIFVQNFLNLVGISQGSSQSSSGDEAILDSVVNQLISFRTQVRDFSLAKDEPDKATRKALVKKRRPLLAACDLVRDKMFEENQIEIKDFKNSSSWSRVSKKQN